MAIIFDWDNTLVESWDAIHVSLNATLTEYGLPPWTMEETRLRVRKSLRDSFPALFGDRWRQAGDFFHQYYQSIHLQKLTPFQGAAEMLAELAADGVYLGVVSNKKGEYLRREAEYLGWDGYFGKIVGANDAKNDKPSPDPVHLALSAGDVKAGPDVWFIGDADIDMECALNAGCIPVLLRERIAGDDEFDCKRPAYHIAQCQELGKLLKSL